MTEEESLHSLAMALTNDSQSNGIVSAGFLLARLSSLGQDSWKLMNREFFESAIPGFGNDEIYQLLEASCRCGVFDLDLYFSNLERMPSPRSRAVVATAVTYYDMNATGESDLAASWMDMILKKVEIPDEHSRLSTHLAKHH